MLGILCTGLFKLLSKKVFKESSILHTVYLVAVCCCMICICKYLKVLNIAFTGIISFASLSNSKVLTGSRVIQSVNNQVRIINDLLKTFLFGGVGASLVISKLDSAHVESAVLLMTLGSIVRFIFGYVMLFRKKGLDTTDKLFLNCSWYPKGAIQAAFASHILAHAKHNNV